MTDAPRRRWALGLCLLAIVVLLWVASGFFVNAMGDEYTKPTFVTYLNTSLMCIYLPLGLHKHKYKQSQDSAEQKPFSISQTAKLSGLFFVLWFTSNLLNNASYYYTTVQSATIISCSSSFFTLLIGAYIGVEHFSLSKVGPLLISIGGIALITREDTNLVTAPPHSLWGNFLALGSAFLYGVYTTLLKRQVGAETNLNTQLFFGFVGVFTLVGLWPLIVVLDWFGIEGFELPPTQRVIGLLALNGLAIMVSDFCWVRSMLLTSPLVVSVGLSATIPLSMLGEMLIYRRYISLLYVFGAALVGYSFWAINQSEASDESEERYAQSR